MPTNKIYNPPAVPQQSVQVYSSPSVTVTVVSPAVTYGPRSIATVNLGALPAPTVGQHGILHKAQAMADAFADKIHQFVGRAQAAVRRTPSTLDTTRLQALLGQSISPKVASRFMDRLEFDHIGRLTGAKPGANLKAKEWAALEGAVQDRHLTQTNAAGPRDAARTEREILLDISGQIDRALGQASSALKPDLEAAQTLVKEHWLNFHVAGNAPTPHLLNFVANKFVATAPELSAAARGLAQEAAKPKTATQAYDNTFGRQFESALVHELIKQPPAPVLQAAAQTGDFLFRQIKSLPPQAQAETLKNLAYNLGHDPRPWHAETPDVARFLAKPDMDNLQAMLKPANLNGYDAVKMSWIGVKASISYPPSTPAPWMAQANDNYASTVVAARSQREALGGTGTKTQTTASSFIQKDLEKLLAPRKADPNTRATSEDQHKYIRQLMDQAAFGANTPAKLSVVLGQLRDHFQPIDPQVANFFAHYQTHYANQPQPHLAFETVHVALDVYDKQQMANQAAQFTPLQTSGYGTVLAHQPQLEGGDNWGKGMAVQGKTTLDMDKIKAFDANALSHEMNSVNGPSGSTNIMSFLYLQMQKEDPQFNLQDAFASTMMFLTFDGGHSLPESVGTFRSITSDTRPTQVGGKPVAEHNQIMTQRRQVLENNVLAYGQLQQLFGSGETAHGVNAAVERAWERTRQTFDAVHTERTKT